MNYNDNNEDNTCSMEYDIQYSQIENNNKNKVYVITNDINDKVYVGKTSRDIETRFKEHVKNASKCNSIIYKAIKKYGQEHFNIKILEDNISNEMINEREKYWIEFYDSYLNGYNLTSGGDGRSLSDKQITQMLDLYYNDGLSCIEICDIMKLQYSTVYHRIAADPRYDKNENNKRAHKNQYKPVSQYDINGNHIKDYISITDAANDIGVKSSRVLQGIRTHSRVKKYYYAYKGEELIISHGRSKKVYQYDLDNNLIAQYPSVRSAGRAMGIDYTNIVKCCNHQRNICCGYIWRYEDEDEYEDEDGRSN